MVRFLLGAARELPTLPADPAGSETHVCLRPPPDWRPDRQKIATSVSLPRLATKNKKKEYAVTLSRRVEIRYLSRANVRKLLSIRLRPGLALWLRWSKSARSSKRVHAGGPCLVLPNVFQTGTDLSRAPQSFSRQSKPNSSSTLAPSSR
jgi:hypothetical protein